jgi:hypothetical protein
MSKSKVEALARSKHGGNDTSTWKNLSSVFLRLAVVCIVLIPYVQPTFQVMSNWYSSWCPSMMRLFSFLLSLLPLLSIDP